MTTNLEALFDAVIVKPLEVEEETYGSIVVPDMGKDKNEHGEVITVGDLVKEVEPGSFVYFDKIAGSDLRIKGEKFKAIREQDVVVTMKDVNSVI